MNLISTHSPLLQLLQTIHNNTDLDPILSSSLKLQALNTLFNQTQTQQKDSLFEIFTNLKALHQFLQQNAAGIGSAPHASKLALENNIQRATVDALLKERLKAQQDTIINIHAVAEKIPRTDSELAANPGLLHSKLFTNRRAHHHQSQTQRE